jgi:hypothetical protein
VEITWLTMGRAAPEGIVLVRKALMTRKVPPRATARAAARVVKPVKKTPSKPAKKILPSKTASRDNKLTKLKVKQVVKSKEQPEKAPAKTKAAPKEVVKVKKVRAKKLPPRMRVRWCVYDGMMKPVALFDYNKKAEAQASLKQFLEKKPTYFMQLVKELLPVPPEEAKPTK